MDTKPHQVVYLTGAPASGKSTVRERLGTLVPNLLVWDYGERLRQHVERRAGRTVNYDQVRANKGELVTPSDIREVDTALVEWVAKQRSESHLLIDTHAVTKEDFGFRATPFSTDQLREILPTRIVVLYCAPEVARARIQAEPMGRAVVSSFEAGFHSALQASIAATYASSLGIPAYYVDSGLELEVVATSVARAGFGLPSR